MINKTKDILKRKYVVPTILTERMEPWEMIAESDGKAETEGMPGGGNDDVFNQGGGPSKYNPFFSPYSDDDYPEE